MIRDLQRVLEPSYVGGLADASIEQIRAMRAECAELENGTSFVRRLAQGRLDLLGEEATQRADGAGGNLGELVSGLADLMSEGMRAAGSGRLNQQFDPPGGRRRPAHRSTRRQGWPVGDHGGSRAGRRRTLRGAAGAPGFRGRTLQRPPQPSSCNRCAQCRTRPSHRVGRIVCVPELSSFRRNRS